MDKIIKVKKGQNLIDIESDGHSECLKINGVISTIMWMTHYQYYAVSKNKSGIEFLKNALPNLEADDEESEILNEIEKLLQLFPSGEYEIKFRNPIVNFYIANDNSKLNTSLDEYPGYFTFCTFNEDDLFAYTKSFEEIDQEIVQGYKHQILIEKKKPLIIVFNVWQFGENGLFIIDGHHKMEAYYELSETPNVLIITKINPQVIVYGNFISQYKDVMNEAEATQYTRMSDYS